MRIGQYLTLVLLVFSLAAPACQQEDRQSFDKAGLSTDREFVFTRGGAPIEVIIKLSATEIDLTDYLTVVIETRFAEGILVTPPLLSDSVYSPLLLVENPVETTAWSEELERMINRWTYRFEPLVSGEFDLKTFSVNFRFEKEKTEIPSKWPVYQIQTEPISYRVNSVEVSTLDDIRDIKGFILPPFDFLPLIIVLVLVFILSVAVLFYFRFVKKQPLLANNTEPVIDRYQEAIRRLDDLERRNLLDQALYEQFHTELSEILRDYLEFYFGMKAKEQTTEEFITEVFDTRQFTEEQRQILKRFLQLADLVKFATFQPESQVSTEAMQKVRSFVKSTGTGHED